MRFFLGLILFGGGLGLAVYYKKVAEAFGFRIGWAERYLGSSYYAYFLFGVIGVILGFLIWVGVIDLGWFGL